DVRMYRQLPNAVKNGTFEGGTSYWDVGATGSIETNDPHGGTNAVLERGVSGWNRTQQWINVQPSTFYHVSGWFRTSDNANDGWFSVRGNPNFGVLNQVHYGAMPAWQQLSFDFFSGDNTQVLLYAGYWAPGADSWVEVDDIFATPWSTPQVANGKMLLGITSGGNAVSLNDAAFRP